MACLHFRSTQDLDIMLIVERWIPPSLAVFGHLSNAVTRFQSVAVDGTGDYDPRKFNVGMTRETVVERLTAAYGL
jgi:hypothetical protein